MIFILFSPTISNLTDWSFNKIYRRCYIMANSYLPGVMNTFPTVKSASSETEFMFTVRTIGDISGRRITSRKEIYSSLKDLFS